METLNLLLNEIGNLSTSLLLTTVFYAMIGGIIGLVISIYTLRKASKKGWLDRSNSLWSFVAKLNYILLPVVLVLIGISQGGIWGAHTTAEKWIDEATTPIIDYLEVYVPEMQQFCDNYVLNQPIGQTKVTVGDLVTLQEKKSNTSSGYVLRQVKIQGLTALLNFAGPLGDMVDPIDKISKIDITDLNRSSFDVFPSSLKAANSYYFGYFYLTCLAPFGTYFMIAIGELVLFFLLGRSNEILPNGNYVDTGSLDLEYV